MSSSTDPVMGVTDPPIGERYAWELHAYRLLVDAHRTLEKYPPGNGEGLSDEIASFLTSRGVIW